LRLTPIIGLVPPGPHPSREYIRRIPPPGDIQAGAGRRCSDHDKGPKAGGTAPELSHVRPYDL